MIKEEMLYGLYAYKINPKTGGKIEDFDNGKFIEIGHKEDLKKKIPAYEDNWNINSNGDTYRFMIKKIGQTSWESLKEAFKKEVPWYLQQGEDGEPWFIGFAKSYDEMLNKLVMNRKSDSIYENSYIDVLDDEMYAEMRDYLDEDEIAELDAYFAENNISEDLPSEIEIEYAILDSSVVEYYNIEVAIKQYLQKRYEHEVVDFRYYWYDVNTLLVHDIEWKKEVKESIVEEVKETKLSDVSVGQSFKVLDDVYYCDVQYEGMFEDDEELLDRFLDAGFKLVGTDLYIQKDTELKYEMFQSVDVYKILKSDFTFDVGEWSEDSLNVSVEIIDNSNSSIDGLKESVESDFWNLRSLKEPKYDTGNLILDGNKIRPLTSDEVANKFAVSIEHADKNDLKSKEELIDFANKTGAEKIMFFFMPDDNYSGEYSFLYSDENKVRDIWKDYKQYAYAKFDENGEYHEITEALEEDIEAGDCAYHPERDEYFYLKKTNKPNTFELYTHSDYRGFEVASPRFIDKNSPFYNKLKLATKNAVSHFKENLEEDVTKELKIQNNENIIEDEKKLNPPIDTAYFPNNMGINLCSVKKEKWTEQDDGQLKKIEIEFEPATEAEKKEQGQVEEDIEKHDTLNSLIFNTETQKMLPEVREKLLEIANIFVDEVHEDELDLEVKDIVLIGSNANYNYTKDSDLDIHIIADSKPDCNKKHLDKIYQAYKALFNKNFDIYIHDIPTEIYVEMDDVKGFSGGIYSVKDNKWLKQPKQFEVPDIDYDAFYKEFEKWEERYFELVNYIDEYDNALEEIDKLIDDIYEVRKEGLASEGEFSSQNLLFKEFRNRKYLDHLKDLKKELQSKEMSLESIDK